MIQETAIMQLHNFLAVTAFQCEVYRIRLQNNTCGEGVSKSNCDVTKNSHKTPQYQSHAL